MASNILSIYYSSSSRLYKQLLVSITSLSLTQDSILHIYLLDCCLQELSLDDSLLTKEQISHLENILKQKNKDSKIFYYDVSDLAREKFSSNNTNESKWRNIYKNKVPLLFIRYLLPYLNISTPNNKMLWLDTDTIIMQDLKELFETNLDNYDIGAVVDKAHCFINRSKLFHQMKINNIDFYNDTFGDKISLNKVLSNKGKKFNNIYNSHHLVYQNGVMLLNLNSYANSFKKLVQDYKTISQMSFGDLNMMNVYCKILELPGKYNCYSISKNSDKVVIFHCCTSICVCGFSSLFYTLKYFNLADVLVDNKMLFWKHIRIKPDKTELMKKCYKNNEFINGILKNCQ